MQTNEQRASEWGPGKWKLWRRRLYRPHRAARHRDPVSARTASVGNYGALVAIPGQEAIIRAPESATLIDLRVQPGQQVELGSMGRMGNLELEEQIAQADSELARARADYDRVLGEQRAHGEAVARAELQLWQRQHDYDEIDAEQQQIQKRRRAVPRSVTGRFILASSTLNELPTASEGLEVLAVPYPAAIAVLQSEVELRHGQLWKRVPSEIERGGSPERD